MSMANIFIYTGLVIMLVGAVFGFFVAIKGYRETDWQDVKKISIWAGFQRGPLNPAMRRLTKIWAALMLIGIILLAIGISIGLK